MNRLFISGKSFVLVALSFEPIFVLTQGTLCTFCTNASFHILLFFSVSLLEMAEKSRLYAKKSLYIVAVGFHELGVRTKTDLKTHGVDSKIHTARDDNSRFQIESSSVPRLTGKAGRQGIF
jgi:hypothetical protein